MNVVPDYPQLPIPDYEETNGLFHGRNTEHVYEAGHYVEARSYFVEADGISITVRGAVDLDDAARKVAQVLAKMMR